ncbi:Aste57867_12453 [Aphanomyces stellatus]|uniref:Aste57867_12453 protein n=1 Tax=Aphanomyces stellatus TaxID=120398 RepID=A0A485KVK2_9STRA|nr:hypothetical protein As57867_012407 [Aphanomyces stellatus]VFT89304.1 Aste57867_12453 [Aphanomyces stellatus]
MNQLEDDDDDGDMAMAMARPMTTTTSDASSPPKLDAKFKAEQALLTALQRPREFHKKEARSIQPMHISLSDMQSYRQSHHRRQDDEVSVTQVRELHHQKLGPSTSTTTATDKVDKIAANALRRRDRHTAAQAAYQSQLKQISEELEGDILRISDTIKDELARVAAATADRFTQLTSKPWLIAASHSLVVDGWTALEALWQGRTASLRAFGAGLEAVEQTRSARVGAELQRLTETCVAAAYVLAPEVERLVEAEAHELNVVLITNRRSHCHLVSRLLKEDMHKFVGVRTQWEACERNWRALNHDHAVMVFQTTLESPLYTYPPRLHAILARLRTDQASVHSNERLALLANLHGLIDADMLASETVRGMVASLAEMYKKEEERNATYFAELFACQGSIVADAVALREELRATCHRVGAKAQEGALADIASQLTALLVGTTDDGLDEFFRIAGGLKPELSTIEERLASPEMIYQDNVAALEPRVAMLVAALPLESILDAQGKSNERKSAQATLERLRKAPKNEIVGLLPTLLMQTTTLAAIQGIDDRLRAELDDIARKLETLIADNDVAAAAAATQKSKGIGLDAFQITDMPGIRKAQRRLGTLVYATDLPPPFQALLHVILQALRVQTHANNVVDEIVAAECNGRIAAREREMQALVAAVGAGLEAQTTQLHVTCDRFARFFYHVSGCIEAYEDKTRVVNLTVMDLLDTLKETHDGNVGAFETEFATRRSALRHAPDERTLDDEFKNCLVLLERLEEEYRKYNKKVSLASTNHPVAISKQNDLFRNDLCAYFALVSPSLHANTTIDQLLSADVIELAVNDPATEDKLDGSHVVDAAPLPPQPSTATLPKSASVVNAAAIEAAASDHADGDAAVEATTMPEKPVFCSRNGVVYDESATMDDLLGRILQRKLLLPGEEPSDDDTPEDPPEKAGETIPPVATEVSTAKKGTPRGQSSAAINNTAAAVPADAVPPSDATPPAATDDQNAASQQPELEIPLASVIAVLDVPPTTLVAMLQALREAMLASFEARSAKHLDDAHAEAKTRVDAYAFLLEECLRMHWPRKGRTDVQIYQPRAGELVSHRQRHGRHVKNVLKKLGLQEAAFMALHADALACLHAQENVQLGFQSQLLMQTSLAALQGLESRSKKAHVEFKGAWGDLLQTKMHVYLTDEPTALVATCRELVTTCTHQVFPDLVSCDVISGCDYHPDEVKLVQAVVAETEAQIVDAVAGRQDKILALGELEHTIGALLVTFKARYHACLQSLSMKEGLGQKYGMPRRNAQERLRSEMARSDNMAHSIDELLHVLLAMGDANAPLRLGPKSPSNRARLVRKTVLDLRQRVYTRGLYLGVLKNKMQLVPRAVQDDLEAATKYDADAPLDDGATSSSPTPFLAATKQFEAQCIADTRSLFQAEGKPLEGDAVPDTLQTYLHEQHDKAVAYVEAQVAAFRTQIKSFEAALAVAARAAMQDIVDRAQTSVHAKVDAVEATFAAQFAAWDAQKERHKAELTPGLCSPNQTHVVAALCAKEAARTAHVQAAIRVVRWQVLMEHVTQARAFHKRLVAMFGAVMAMLDSCTMPADLETAPDDDQHKRKSLKRLRKALRQAETGDPLAVDLAPDETAALTEAKERQRFPKRAWPGLAVVPIFDIPAMIKEDSKDVPGAEPPPPPVVSDVAVPVGKGGKADKAHHDKLHADKAAAAHVDQVENGACVGYVTDAHRAAVASRNDAHAAYCAWFDASMESLGRKYTTLLREEELWFVNWGQLIRSMQSQDAS